MVAEWPDPASLAGYRDEGAERSVGKMLEIVVAVRTVRSRYSIPPKQGISVVVRTQAETDVQLLDAEFAYLNALAGIDSFVAATDAAKPAHSVTVVAGGMEVYVPLEGLVDFDAERIRVAKQLASAADDLAKVERKLVNEGFLAKAAAEVIDKERSKEAELADRVAALREQLDELEG
jgi:valyl-tRNA synthetase